MLAWHRRRAAERSTSHSTTCGCRARSATRWRTPCRAGGARGVAVRIALQRGRAAAGRRRGARSSPRPPRTEPSRIARDARRAAAADPGLARPDAPQVRRARRTAGLDGLDELDARRLDAPGERRRHAGADRAVARRYTRNFAQRGDAARIGSSGDFDTRAGRGVRPLVLPRPRAGAVAPHREADRRRPPARPDRLAAAHRRADPRHAGRGGGRGARRRGRRVRRHAGRAGLRPVGGQPALALEGAAAGALPGRPSPASAARRTRRAPCTTTCTPSSPSPTTSCSSAPSTFRARARTNAENVLEIADAGLADELAAYVDSLRARYPGRVSPRG